MSKKQLDVSELSNELEEASAFFRREPLPSSLVPLSSEPKEQKASSVSSSHRHTSVTSHRNTVTPSHQSDITPSHRHTITPDRAKKKHGFVVYRDQVESLEKLVLEVWQTTGAKPEVGDFVRQALDTFLATKEKGSKL
jgi:hypothetical protein